jgi:hypothetical protein
MTLHIIHRKELIMFIDKNSLYMDDISMGQYLTQVKYEYNKLWSSDTGRTLSGKMTGTLIGIFPKIIMSFRKLTQAELVYLAPHFDNSRQTITYKDPFKNQNVTITTYTGDWETTYKNMDKAEPFELSFISTDRRR